LLKQIGPRIFVVTPEDSPRYPYGNCLYVEDDIPAVLDLGAGGRAFQEIPCEKVQLALISHSHFDHLHGDSFFPRAGLYAGKEESKTYSDENEYLKFHGYELWAEMMPGIKRVAFSEVSPLPDDVPVKPGFRYIELAGIFKDMERFHLGKTEITAIHLPGHTTGHYGFWIEKEGILFSADMDLVVAGPWYSSNSADIGQLISSVQRIREINPGLIVPSHRRLIFDKIEKRLDQYIGVVFKRQEHILDLLKETHSLDELLEYQMVFHGRRDIYLIFWEKMTLRNHIRFLLREGMVEEVEKGRYKRC